MLKYRYFKLLLPLCRYTGCSAKFIQFSTCRKFASLTEQSAQSSEFEDKKSDFINLPYPFIPIIICLSLCLFIISETTTVRGISPLFTILQESNLHLRISILDVHHNRTFINSLIKISKQRPMIFIALEDDSKSVDKLTPDHHRRSTPTSNSIEY